MKNQREVRIEVTEHNFFVFYVNRKKGGRYMAAQFNNVDNTLQNVIDWISKQKNLILVNEKKEQPKSNVYIVEWIDRSKNEVMLSDEKNEIIVSIDDIEFIGMNMLYASLKA